MPCRASRSHTSSWWILAWPKFLMSRCGWDLYYIIYIYTYTYIYIYTYISSIFGSSHLVYIWAGAGSGSWDPWLNKTTNKTAAFLSPWIVYIYIRVYMWWGVGLRPLAHPTLMVSFFFKCGYPLRTSRMSYNCKDLTSRPKPGMMLNV